MMGLWFALALASHAGAEAGAATGPAASQPADVRWGPFPDTNTDFKPAHYGSLDEWKKRREWLRMQARVATGLWPEPEKCPLNAKIFGKIQGKGYTIEKVHFESYPGLHVTGNLYRPTQHSALSTQHSSPGVLCPHGHWKNGRLEQSEIGNIPARCIMLARMGCTVFSYDMVGYNDSARQFDHRKINSPVLDLWGITSMHLQTWNSVRAIDFLQSLPEVDPERIGVTGASGGGTQTFMIAAVDDRVSVTCPVNMISHTMQGGCSCENAPCLRIDTNNMEIGALFAPKPMLMVSATGDWTKDTPQVEYPFTKGIYALYGKAENVENAHIDAEHNYNQQSREAMYRFFAKHLLGWPEEKANAVKEHDIPAYKAEDLLVWTDETAPKDLGTWDLLSGQVRAYVDRPVKEIPDKDSLVSLSTQVRTGLQQMLGSDPMVRYKASFKARNDLQVWRNGREVLLPYDPTAHSSDILAAEFCFCPSAPAAPRREDVTRILPYIFRMDPSAAQAGGRVRAEERSFFSTFNRSDAAETVFDMVSVLTAGMLIPRDAQNWLRADGRMGPEALVARALRGDRIVRRSRLRTVIDMNRFDIDSDEAYLKALNIPHIRRIGGLRAIAAVACNGPIWFHNVGDHFDEAFVKAAGRINSVEVRVTKAKAGDEEIAEWLMRGP